MKNIANVVILALLISVGCSIGKNYVLLKDISSMHAYMKYSVNHLKDGNDIKQKKHWNKMSLLLNTDFKNQDQIALFTKEGILTDDYSKSIDDNLNSTRRFYLEKKRRTKLNRLTPHSTTNTFSNKYVHPRIGFNDELHIGFCETIINNCKYEVFINGVQQKSKGLGTYECRNAPKILIDINKIFINTKTQSLDTVCISKMIARA